jgi:hypothetical protein
LVHTNTEHDNWACQPLDSRHYSADDESHFVARNNVDYRINHALLLQQKIFQLRKITIKESQTMRTATQTLGVLDGAGSEILIKTDVEISPAIRSLTSDFYFLQELIINTIF